MTLLTHEQLQFLAQDLIKHGQAAFEVDENDSSHYVPGDTIYFSTIGDFAYAQVIDDMIVNTYDSSELVFLVFKPEEKLHGYGNPASNLSLGEAMDWIIKKLQLKSAFIFDMNKYYEEKIRDKKSI